MTRRYGALILVPGLSLAVFLVELLRRHGHEGVSAPAWLAVGLAIACGLAAAWVAYARLLERLAGLGAGRALRLGSVSFLPLLLLPAYLLPAVQRRPNAGTLLLSATLAGCLLLTGAVLAYYRRESLAAAWAHPQLALAAIAGAALLVRLGPIAANRLHGDEALFSYWGLLVATGRDVFLRAELVDKPPLLPYSLALSFKLFGVSETAARIPNLLASVATVATVYGLGQTLYDRRAGALAALFLALSPFAVQFAPTAFTDPLMVALALAACLAAARGRFFTMGLALALAVATKAPAVFLAPLVLVLAGWGLGREGWAKRPVGAGLRLAAGLAAVGAPWWLWEAVIRVGCTSTFAAGSAHNRLTLVPPAEWWPRVQGWLRLAQYFTGSPALNAALLVGLPLLLAYGLWRPRARRGWLADWVLAGFALSFVAAHTVLSFSVWDRYLLGLVPVAALLAARVVLLPCDLLLAGRATSRAAAGYGAVLALALAVALLPPAGAAARHRFPIGGDRGAHQGIDDVAGYLKGSAPPGSLVFHQWLGWHFSFYLFDVPVRTVHYDTPEALLATARAWAAPEAYVIFAAPTAPAHLSQLLAEQGWGLEGVHRTYRPDGSVSFLVCRLRPSALDLSSASRPSPSWPTTGPGPACRPLAARPAPGA